MDSVPLPDEKDIHRAESFFKYGNEAAAKGNLPYAIDMYKNALKIAPMELKYRQALRAVGRKKFNNDPSKVGMFAGAKLQPIRLKIKASKGRGHWLEALEHCEEAFVVSPWDVGASRDFAEAAEQLGSRPLARWAMEAVQAQAAEDVAFWKQMAHVYAFCEDFPRAILCWERIKKLNPADDEAAHQINALSASQTIHGSGLHEQVRRNEAQLAAEKSEVDGEVEAIRGRQALSPEQRFERDLQEDPARPGPYLELAEHYRRQQRLDEARDVLARGLKALPDQASLRDSYAEVQIARLKKAIEALKLRLKDHPDDAESKSKLAALTTKLADYELAEFRRRVEARPEDPGLRYEYGRRLAASGQHDAAIGEFQAARSSPALKVKALIGAGGSFEASGVPKLAERSYAEALKAVDAEDVETLNDLHYRLGRVAEQLGNHDAAESHYNEVAANNFGYLDVAQRLRSLNQRMSS
ncbi:tetratricopeptide repeat protein [Tautonia plasticadhaerens]|uniref:Tetratricopeptide repeat protein n=1 Tax=Tautonia plasticadhaerens TaxID=2527974 RepID=A0A518HAM2_9BACT|nr:tetratricopeptide repeat protein [Tautonia plasticadhaerens]QDV37905.1 Tetratricopeptide repeat protein [Tautonia plasticadhaerens]